MTIELKVYNGCMLLWKSHPKCTMRNAFITIATKVYNAYYAVMTIASKVYNALMLL